MDSGVGSYRRFLDGDESGLVEIIRDYKDGLILYINGIVHNIHIAEELTEDTFVCLAVRRPTDKGNGSFKTWLYTMGRNRALDYLRRQKRRREIPWEEGGDAAEVQSVEEAYLKEERRRLLHRGMNRLKEEYRQVLWLIYFEGFTCRQAASVLKKRVHTVEVLVSRARRALVEELHKEGYTYESL